MSAPTYLHASCTPGPNRKAKDGDSCAEPQQPFRFMDLPPELRDIIYTFTLCKETRKLYFENNLNELNLLAGLSKSLTARALNQVCRTVRQESIKVFYFKKTFVVRGVPVQGAGVMPMPYNEYPPPCFARPDPLDLWAQTWGVLGAQHIRTSDVSQSVGVVRTAMADGANPVSFDNEERYLILSASALKAAGSKAFGTSSKRMTAARKIERFLCEVEVELRAADNRLRDNISIYRRSIRKIR